MLYLIVGSNAYQADREVERLQRAFAGEAERYDGETMTLETLAGLAQGQSLFSEKRLVIIRGLAQNKSLWEKAGDMLKDTSDDTTLVLVEPMPDKRTKTYKALAKLAKAITVDEWSERQQSDAQAWLREEAKKRGLQLTSPDVAAIIERAIVQHDSGKRAIDQYAIVSVLERLPVGEKVSEAMIDAMLPPSTQANVFGLLELALMRKSTELARALERLQHVEDAYKVTALVISQWAQLVAVKFAEKPPSSVATDIGAAPFAVQRMAQLAGQLSAGDTQRFTELLADTDMAAKSTGLDPWTLLERFLNELAARA